MELIEYVRALRRRWPVLVAAIVVGAVVAWLIPQPDDSEASGPIGGYEASVLLLDNRGSQVSASRGANGITIDTLTTLATIDDVAERAAKRLQADADPDALAGTVSAASDSQTSILTITATAETGPRAERVAEAFANALIDYLKGIRSDEIRPELRSLRRQLAQVPTGRGGDTSARQGLLGQISALNAELNGPIGLPIIEQSEASEVAGTGLEGPSSETGRILLGAAIGLLGGIVLMLVLERFDQRIRTRRGAEQHITVPLLAEIPKLARASRRRVSVTSHPTSPGADAFRLLASAVLHALQVRSSVVSGNGHGMATEPATLVVTSATQGEGKSLTAANLAAALGELGKRVLVISCDLRRPKVHWYLDAEVAPGVVDALHAWDGQAAFRRITQGTSSANVSVIASGSPTARPAAVLAGEHMDSLLRMAREAADVVIVDTPAILLSGDAASLTQNADGVLLVTRIGTTSTESAERVSEILERLGAPIIGYVLNESRLAGGGVRYRPYRAPATSTVVLPASETIGEPIKMTRVGAPSADRKDTRW